MKFTDIGIVTAVAMLAAWAILTFVVNDAPGITHALLVAGLTLLIWRIVKLDAPAEKP